MPQRMNSDQGSADLLLAISRYGRDSGPNEIAGAAASVRDWGVFVNLTHAHRMAPQAYFHLERMGEAVPTKARESLSTLYERNVVRNMANASELRAILIEFERRGIQVLPFKGIVLGMMLYGNLTSRAAGDLDLLIFEHDSFRAASALLERGFDLKTRLIADGSPEDNFGYEYHFERADGMTVELRWRLELVSGRFTRNLGMEWLQSRCGKETIAGFETPATDAESTLLILCMHGSKHAWSRLYWIVDVAHLLRKHPELDWERIKTDAKRFGLERSLALGVLLARRVCGTEVPQKILRRFQSFRRIDAISRHIQTNLFDAQCRMPESRIPYNIRLLDLHDRIAFLLSMKALRPNENDRKFLPLPKGLSFLYFLVRPIRLLWDRSART